MPQVTISIVTYNSAAVLGNCIDSIISSIKDTSYEIIVVDNNSEDDSVKIIKDNYPSVILIENKKNVGFGAAHNQAFALSKGKYFLILNPDTVIFHEAIDKAILFMESKTDSGIVGCKIWWDDDKTFMFPDLKLHSLKTALVNFGHLDRCFTKLAENYRQTAYDLWNATEPIIVDGVTGGFMLVRREAFETVNGFDENFFLFFEEHDLQKRIKKQGWNIYYIPDAEIQHLYEESCRNSQLNIGKIYLQSALYYYNKHYGQLGSAFIKLLIQISGPFKRSQHYPAISPDNNYIYIEWETIPQAIKYLVEISYSSDFNDRGGMYIEKSPLAINADILKRLPNNTGFIKISPVYRNNIHGKSVAIYKITDKIQ